MEENKYNILFNITKNNLTTMLLARPILYYINAFGSKDILQIREKHYEKGFRQCFLNENGIDNQTVFVTYNKESYVKKEVIYPVEHWDAFYNSISKCKYFLEEYIINDETFSFKLRFPLIWSDDFENIINGDYSKVSDEYITKFYPNKTSLLYHLKNKTTEARDFYGNKFKVDKKLFDTCEVGPKMILEKEIFQSNVHKILI
jgi:hypothetical protein